MLLLLLHLTGIEQKCVERMSREQQEQEGEDSDHNSSRSFIIKWSLKKRSTFGMDFYAAPTLFIVALLLCHTIGQSCGSQLADFDGATFYKAPVGSRVRIACNGSHWNDESVSLVLWFKGTIERHSVPIYTVDARQKPLNEGARHFIADRYKGRARFVTKASPPYLDLAPLEAEDQSEYRCRIDYRSKPRENFLIILFVLVPPKSVQIIESGSGGGGKSVESQIYGPLSEDSDLTLVCLSKGGRPAPSVTWKRRKEVIDDSYLTLNDFLALKQSARLLANSEEMNHRSGKQSQALVPTPGNWNSTGRAGPTDSINAAATATATATDPSLAQLESLSLEWRNLPEFTFFASNNQRLDNRTGAAQQLTSDPSPPLIFSTGARDHLTGFNEHKVNASQRSQHQQPLLTLEVAESITTAVNVLSISPLSSLNLRQFAPAEQAQPKLECEASNLHYDLRTLIKLFAPPSLMARQLDSKPSEDFALAEDLQSDEMSQLVRAIDFSLQMSSKAASDWPVSQSQQHELATGSQHANGSIGHAAAALYLQLSRPHQLAAASRERNEPASNSPHLRQDMEQSDDAVAADVSATADPTAGQDKQQQQAVAVTGSGSEGEAKNPLVRSKLIALDIYTRPIDVRIVTPLSRPLSAGQLAEFQCHTSGSRPQARISWLKNGQLIEQKLHRQVDEFGGNSSRSKLSLRLEQQDHGSQLTCRAENEQLSARWPKDKLSAPAILEDTRTLSVHYAPKLKLELGSRILSRNIREGSDIYFVCQVEAQPQVREITWLHNERPVNETSTSSENNNNNNLIISNNSLVLQRIRVEQRGHYACMASNSEGLGESNRIELRVLHAPRCANPTGVTSLKRVAPLGNRIRLVCHLAADPPELELTWYLNTSFSGATSQQQLRLISVSRPEAATREEEMSGKQSVQRQNNGSGAVGVTLQSKHEPTKSLRETMTSTSTSTATLAAKGITISQLDYLLDTSTDYGQLYCVGRNSIGEEQQRSCSYEIVQPDPNEAPQLNCLAVNVSSTQAWLACDRPQFSPLATPASESSHQQLERQKLINPASDSAWPNFTVEVYSLPRELQHQFQGDSWPQTAKLEAQLSSAALGLDPLLELSNLRPNTAHAVQVQASLDDQVSQQALVKFITSDGPMHNRAVEVEAISYQDQDQAFDGEQPALISALISTRSTTAADHQLQAHLSPTFNATTNSVVAGFWGRRLAEQQQQQQLAATQTSASALSQVWNWLWNSTGIGPLARRLAGQKSSGGGGGNNNNQLMDLSDALLLASIGLLLLLASLASVATLLLRQRRDRNQMQPEKPSQSNSHSTDDGDRQLDAADLDDDCCSSSGGGGGATDLARSQQSKLNHLAAASSSAAMVAKCALVPSSSGHSSSSPTHSGSTTAAHAPYPATMSATATANQSIGTMGRGASYATLDLGARSTVRQQQQQHHLHHHHNNNNNNNNGRSSAAQLFDQPTIVDQQQYALSNAARPICATKSRSSLCLDALLNSGNNGFPCDSGPAARLSAKDQQQQQQLQQHGHRLIYQNTATGRLISDANFQQQQQQHHWHNMTTSEESSDSNCTWSPHNPMTGGQVISASAASNGLADELHFIELLPSSSADCLDPNLMGKLLIGCTPTASNATSNYQLGSAATTTNFITAQQQQQQQLVTPMICNSNSLASSSIGSTSIKDQAACCSPRSLTNTTLSNTESLLNGAEQQMTPVTHMQQLAYGPMRFHQHLKMDQDQENPQITSILKNSKSNQLIRQSGKTLANNHNGHNLIDEVSCQCGNDQGIEFTM